MKRAAEAISDPPSSKGPTRVTRSATRLVQNQAERDEERVAKEHECLEKANALMATPLLQALPLVVGKSGFLYKCECRNAALVSKNWKSIVAECTHEIPRDNQVQIKVEYSAKQGEGLPAWVTHRGLEDVFPTQEFSRTIFSKMCELKVAAEPTARKQQKVRDSLPKWGQDFLGIRIFVWGPGRRNRGGLYFSISKFSEYQGTSCSFVPDKLQGWNIRLDKYLRFWTWDSFRKWQKVYNGAPLWDWDFISSDAYHSSSAGNSSEDDSDF